MPSPDHKAEALILQYAAENLVRRAAPSGAFLDRALVLSNVGIIHSNLAIAEGQERVAGELLKIGKRLDSITDVSPRTQFGSGKRYLKVKP